jgi:CRP-like cAMP-binding protein
MDSRLDLLNGLTAEEVGGAMSLGTRITLAAGAVLFQAGDSAGRIFFIRRGCIWLTLPVQVGGKEREELVEERTPGQTVGWSALIPPYRYTLKATAPVETELIALSRRALFQYSAAHPSVDRTLSRNISAVIGPGLMEAILLRAEIYWRLPHGGAKTREPKGGTRWTDNRIS